tara:strand:+ start:50 stop:517 length:468 start_codon:yes stop_codon:yes gene_type:complete
MNRERDAWKKMKDNAQERFEPAQVYDVTPLPQPKTSYLSATIWTAVVATLVCSIFMGLLLYVVNESNIEGNLTKAVSQAISGLKQSVNQQNNEIQNLRAENKKIHEYLKLWTPINNRLPPGVEERWKIRGYGLPTYELQSHNTCKEDALCLPLFQ